MAAWTRDQRRRRDTTTESARKTEGPRHHRQANRGPTEITRKGYREMASLHLKRGRSWTVCWRENGRSKSRQFGHDRPAAEAFLATMPAQRPGPKVRSVAEVLAHIDARCRDDDGCRIWIGQLSNSGYPRMTWKRDGHKPEHGAHRIVYVATFGEIPAGLTIDHLCQRPRCVNPLHMEPVTRAENSRRMQAARKLAAA